MPTITPRTIRHGDCPVMPWRNGQGSTTELAIEPPGAALDGFDWRISIARASRIRAVLDTGVSTRHPRRYVRLVGFRDLWSATVGSVLERGRERRDTAARPRRPCLSRPRPGRRGRELSSPPRHSRAAPLRPHSPTGGEPCRGLARCVIRRGRVFVPARSAPSGGRAAPAPYTTPRKLSPLARAPLLKM